MINSTWMYYSSHGFCLNLYGSVLFLVVLSCTSNLHVVCEVLEWMLTFTIYTGNSTVQFWLSTEELWGLDKEGQNKRLERRTSSEIDLESSRGTCCGINVQCTCTCTCTYTCRSIQVYVYCLNACTDVIICCTLHKNNVYFACVRLLCSGCKP